MDFNDPEFSVVPELILDQVPLRLPFLHRFDGGFVASSGELSEVLAREIFECHQYCPIYQGLRLRPIFKWCQKGDEWQKDIVHGVPSDQSAEMWDKPCGITLALNWSSVYGCIDRTVEINKPWRKLDLEEWVLAWRKDRYLLACSNAGAT